MSTAKSAFGGTKKTPQTRRFFPTINVEAYNDLALTQCVLNTNLNHSTKGIVRVPVIA